MSEVVPFDSQSSVYGESNSGGAHPALSVVNQLRREQQNVFINYASLCVQTRFWVIMWLSFLTFGFFVSLCSLTHGFDQQSSDVNEGIENTKTLEKRALAIAYNLKNEAQHAKDPWTEHLIEQGWRESDINHAHDLSVHSYTNEEPRSDSLPSLGRAFEQIMLLPESLMVWYDSAMRYHTLA